MFCRLPRWQYLPESLSQGAKAVYDFKFVAKIGEEIIGPHLSQQEVDIQSHNRCRPVEGKD